MDEARSWEDTFLSWFASLGIQMSEKTFALGQLRYHQFSTLFEIPGHGLCAAHGRSINRQIAAVKCAAEFVERRVSRQFFQKNAMGPRAQVLAHEAHLDRSPPTSPKMRWAPLPPTKSLRTSNGWAVHQSEAQAIESATHEALERHLLLKSFMKWGWAGFNLAQRIPDNGSEPGIALSFLTSRLSVGGLVSGMVVAKPRRYPGVSFGYCLGRADHVNRSTFWEHALLEAVDLIFALNGERWKSGNMPDSWIRSRLRDFLEKPFDLDLLPAGASPTLEEDPPSGRCMAYNLASNSSGDQTALSLLPRPLQGADLWAAYVWGGTLIPLFDKPSLEADGQDALDYLQSILHKHNLSLADLPERHPIL